MKQLLQILLYEEFCRVYSVSSINAEFLPPRGKRESGSSEADNERGRGGWLCRLPRAVFLRQETMGPFASEMPGVFAKKADSQPCLG